MYKRRKDKKRRYIYIYIYFLFIYIYRRIKKEYKISLSLFSLLRKYKRVPENITKDEKWNYFTRPEQLQDIE